MRAATLALTQDLKMDNVLDTLLRSLADLIPYETAQILFVESESRLFVARAAPSAANSVASSRRLTQCSSHCFASSYKTRWTSLSPTPRKSRIGGPAARNGAVRSWFCVRLIASHRILGLLCAGHSAAGQFTGEHQRLARSLAIPAAAAIQNARLYECAKIYGAELERSSSDLQDAQNALMRFQSGRPS